ncbi:hypothetical protein C7S18_16275 [Ahniella affigens]|uniref:Uncharacterized protein n=1 Tax=Ahniella affigens TaxID=2021234 RepID=A0A2P1PUX3_9GAMM|nr:hypothetical protein [Ahniella affigens]AVP98647.1 hypothetical protein C7S18_16275 [Ahniella affigens]
MAAVSPLMLPTPVLVDAANHHLCLEFGDWPDPFWDQVVGQLESEFGMQREGMAVEGPGERIEPSFVGQGVRLLSGWDCHSGRYLLAESDAGDALLRDVYRKASESKIFEINPC